MILRHDSRRVYNYQLTEAVRNLWDLKFAWEGFADDPLVHCSIKQHNHTMEFAVFTRGLHNADEDREDITQWTGVDITRRTENEMV